jgi:methylase of polypeptide subunit release factors
VRALDLGCGSGIQGLLIAAGRASNADGASVLALDVNPRALAFCRFNAALNDLSMVDVRAGDFLAQAIDESLDDRFDLVVANPPFVLAPSHELVYRDRSLPGDGVSRRTVERAARALAPGGRGYILCNWIDDGYGDWTAAVREWVEALPVDTLVTRVADDSPATYAARWTKDLPAEARPAATAIWAASLEAEGVRRVHVGVIAIERPTAQTTQMRRFVAVDRVTPSIAGVTAAWRPSSRRSDNDGVLAVSIPYAAIQGNGRWIGTRAFSSSPRIRSAPARRVCRKAKPTNQSGQPT